MYIGYNYLVPKIKVLRAVDYTVIYRACLFNKPRRLNYSGIGLCVFFVFVTSLFLFGRADIGECSIYYDEDPDKLLHKIVLPMTVGEQAQIVFPDGRAVEIGRILAVPTGSRYPGFTASKYGLGGQIIAAAVNAHHIQVSVEDGAGRTMSIIPARTYVAASGQGSSFVVEGEGGTGIWGEYSPYVGSPIYIINGAGMPVRFNTMQVFKFARAVEIRVYAPEDAPEFLEIENRPGGRIWYRDSRGDHEFGVVESAVSGTGRFEGSVYQSRGMIRANHPGVICISTCERGKIGGFQIVPRSHTFSKELQKTRNMSQYIVVRGPGFEDLTGEQPFFRGAVRPGDWALEGSMAGRVLCFVDGEWEQMPNLEGLTEKTLGQVESFRIYLR